MVGSTICWVTSSINTRSCRRNGSWKWNKTINTDPPLLSSVGESKYALWKRRIYLMIYSCHSIIVGWYRRQEFRTSKWEAVLEFFNISAKNKISFKKFDLWLKRAISAERDLIYCSTSFDIQSFILPCILWLFILPCISGHLPFLHPEHLVLELLSQLRMDALINPHGVENQTNGQQGVHLVIHFSDLKIVMEC